VPQPDDAAVDDDAPRWGLGHALVGYFVAYLLAVLFGGLYAGVAGLEEGDPRTLGLAIASLIGLWLGMGGAVCIAARTPDRLRTDFGLDVRWSDVPIGAAIGVASQLILVRLLYLPFELRDPDLAKRLEEPAKELTDLAHGPGFVVLAVMVTIGAPLIEELFFRGLLQRSLRRRLAAPGAVALSAIAFGLAHYQPLQLLGLVGFGVVLGIMAERYGRLGPGIVAHVAFNLVTVIALAAAR
jgi:uncharacterized protein